MIFKEVMRGFGGEQRRLRSVGGRVAGERGKVKGLPPDQVVVSAFVCTTTSASLNSIGDAVR